MVQSRFVALDYPVTSSSNEVKVRHILRLVYASSSPRIAPVIHGKGLGVVYWTCGISERVYVTWP